MTLSPLDMEALRADRDRLLAELARAAAELEAARAEIRALLARINPQVRADAPPAGPLTWAEYDRR
jgi:outer membrane protein TolC